MFSAPLSPGDKGKKDSVWMFDRVRMTFSVPVRSTAPPPAAKNADVLTVESVNDNVPFVAMSVTAPPLPVPGVMPSPKTPVIIVVF